MELEIPNKVKDKVAAVTDVLLKHGDDPLKWSTTHENRLKIIGEHAKNFLNDIIRDIPEFKFPKELKVNFDPEKGLVLSGELPEPKNIDLWNCVRTLMDKLKIESLRRILNELHSKPFGNKMTKKIRTVSMKV